MKTIKFDNTQKKVFEVSVDGEKYTVEVSVPAFMAHGVANDTVHSKNVSRVASPIVHLPPQVPTFDKNEQGILAPMPGNITAYHKKVGDKVVMGETIVVLEAMKMYNNLSAPCDGVVKEIAFSAGDNVKKYDSLCLITRK
jgi:biotin carboxyl carrier protein